MLLQDLRRHANSHLHTWVSKDVNLDGIMNVAGSSTFLALFGNLLEQHRSRQTAGTGFAAIHLVKTPGVHNTVLEGTLQTHNWVTEGFQFSPVQPCQTTTCLLEALIALQQVLKGELALDAVGSHGLQRSSVQHQLPDNRHLSMTEATGM